MFNNIEKENLSHRIIHAIRDHIFKNRLQPGDRLATEREMAHALGVSRTSVREAVKILEAIGVLESRPKHGISVKEFDPQEILKFLSFMPGVNKENILEILELRQTFDLGMVDLVIERATDEDLAALAREVEAMRSTLNRPVEFYTHDWAFHFAVYEATRNLTIQSLGRFLIEFFVVIHRERWNREQAIAPEHFHNHERIYLALKAGDPDAMRQAIRDHFNTSLAKRLEREDFMRDAGSDAIRSPER